MWFPLALFDAILSSVTTPINKHQIKTIQPITVLLVNQIFSVLFMFLIIMYLGGIPHVTSKFFFLMFCSSVLDITAFSCSYWAIKHAPVSLLAPLSSFTPVFATFFGVLFLHEIPTPLKLLGVITIVFGLYLLNIASVKGGFLKPFKTLFSQKGVRLYFVQVVIFGITPIFQKQAIFQTKPVMPVFAAFTGYLFIVLYLSLFRIKKLRYEKTAVLKNKWYFVLYGLISAFSQLIAYIVFSQTFVGYATAIFNLSILFTIIIGGMIFKETNIKERLLGASVMILGAILLAM